MSLRPFSRLLTRSFKINRAKVESSPGIVVSQGASMLVAGSGRPARSLHTIRDVGAGDSTYGAVAAAAAAALTGGAGILIFKKRPDDDDGDVTMKDMKVDIKKEEDMGKHRMDVDLEARFHKWMEGMDVDLEARFHKWMEEMGREYPNEEEKAFRFELFKERQKNLFRRYERREEEVPLPNCFGDMTDDEIKAMLTRCHPPRSKEYEASEMRYHQIMKKKMDEVMLLIEKKKREGMSSTAQSSSNAVSGHD